MKKICLSHFFAIGILVVVIIFGSACSSVLDAVTSVNSIDEVSGLQNKLIWLQHNVQNGGNYIIELNGDEWINNGTYYKMKNYHGNFSYKDKSNVTIVLRGVGKNCTISNSQIGGYLFNIGSGVTLILDNNITLKGLRPESLIDGKETTSIVVVSSGGKLVMNNGSMITGGMNNADHGGGVRVLNNATFLMQGGIIAGNTCFPIADAVALAASAKTGLTGQDVITNLTNPGIYKGAGVYVSGGTFTKTGGIIYGNTGNSNGNVVKDWMDKNVINNVGHAVYADNSTIKSILVIQGNPSHIKFRDTTAGQEEYLHYSKGEFKGNWNNEGSPVNVSSVNVQTVNTPTVNTTTQRENPPARENTQVGENSLARENTQAREKVQARENSQVRDNTHARDNQTRELAITPRPPNCCHNVFRRR